MSAQIGGITVSVDMRGSYPLIRDQGARPSCVACAVSDAHGAGHQLDHGLSAEYLLYHAAQYMSGGHAGNGLSFDAADLALQQAGQPHEHEWPYQMVQPDPWEPPKVGQTWHGTVQGTGAELTKIFDALGARSPVVMGLRLVNGFRRVQHPPHIVDEAGPAGGRHAVVAVGKGRRPSSPADDLVLIRNSWGPAWGSDGHAWLTREYLMQHLVECRVAVPAKTN